MGVSTDHSFRRQIVRIGKMLHERGYIAACDGNISVRLDDERVLVTPTAMSKGAMQAADLCLIPCRPAGPDLHASRPTMEALRAMGRDFALVINQASPNKAAKITAAVMASLSHDGLVLPVAVASRIDHQYAYALGQGAAEYAPEGKAAEEIRELWAWCSKRLARNEVGHEQEKRSA